MTNWHNWLKGALSAAISGAAGVLISINVDPDHFNAANLRHLAIVGGVGAFVGVINYLKQSPLAPSPVASSEKVGV